VRVSKTKLSAGMFPFMKMAMLAALLGTAWAQAPNGSREAEGINRSTNCVRARIEAVERVRVPDFVVNIIFIRGR
jgi:hypothetical protein